MKNLVVTINGRDAVPVRALCFADDPKRLSPDLVAQAAAGEDHYEGTWRLPTYHMSEGSTTELKASQWAYCCRRLKSISSRLKSTWGGADSWDLWRSEATPVLPAGVFVWLDEFREWYGLTRPWKVKKAHLLLAHPEGDEQHDNVLKEVLESMERPWDTVGDDLSLVQPISESDYCMAMEGFPLACVQPSAPTPEQPVSAVADREELARLRAEAEARRKEEERKAAEAHAAEEARLAAERAEIAKQREEQEAKAWAERVELEHQAAELRAQQEVVRRQQEAVAAETKRLEDERIAAEHRVAEEAIETDAHRIEQEPNQSEPAEASRSTQTTLDFGVTKGEILIAFPRPIQRQTEEQWANMLADAGRAKWLKDARVDRGGRGVQSRWNPAQLAMCLAEKGHMQRKALGNIIRRDFPAYLSEWEAYAGSFE